ncbi:MAG: hypothetical protein H0W72_17770 [Planctomycetes bacterium]|nr:hypothetical protein [Planctomycetota bacterium]
MRTNATAKALKAKAVKAVRTITPSASAGKGAKAAKGAIVDRDQKASMFRPGPAPRVEPSTRGANQWTSGRRDKRKSR